MILKVEEKIETNQDEARFLKQVIALTRVAAPSGFYQGPTNEKIRIRIHLRENPQSGTGPREDPESDPNYEKTGSGSDP